MKPVYVSFGSKKIEKQFEELKGGRYEDKTLYEHIEKAIREMKADPACGIKVPKRLWPKEYIKEYSITNLWKYDLPEGWRLIYTIQTNEVLILNVILEWFSHKDYEKRFKF